MIKYDESYYEPEEIEGFHVTSMMKRFWAAGLEILVEIDRICKKYNIKYFLMYGSLIGAIRHKGYIPWDDDLDIGMLREDYKKFLEVIKYEIQPPFVAANADHNSCIYPCSIKNGNIPHMDEAFLSRFHGCPYVAGVDVFPLDNFTENEEELEEFKNIYMVVRYLAQRLDPLWDKEKLPEGVKTQIDHPDIGDINEVIEGVEAYLGINIPRDGNEHILLSQISDELAQTFNDENCRNVVYMNCMPMPSCNGIFLPIEAFDDVIEVEFQGMKFPAPIGYERVLEAEYGKNWRTPVKGTAAHDYPVYKRQAKNLENIYVTHNISSPDYYFL